MRPLRRSFLFLLSISILRAGGENIKEGVVVMRHFVIVIDGVPPLEVADKFWVEIARYDVNFTVLDRHSYIYGYATNRTINEIVEKSERFGFKMTVERGEVYDDYSS